MGKSKIDRQWLYKQPLWPPKYTPEEAFEEGRKVAKGEIPKGVETGYDIAARAFARGIVEWADRNPMLWQEIALKIEDAKEAHKRIRDKTEAHQVFQRLLLDAISMLNEWEDDGLKGVDQKAGGVTGFQTGWAIQTAYYILKEEGK